MIKNIISVNIKKPIVISPIIIIFFSILIIKIHKLLKINFNIKIKFIYSFNEYRRG